MIVRDDDTWVRHLSQPGCDRDAAIADLRSRLLTRLRTTWSGRELIDDSGLEDAVQTAVLQILQNVKQFTGRSQFLTWATTIAVHAVVNEVKRRKWSTVSLEAVTQNAATKCDPADQATSPQTVAQRREILQLLQGWIDGKLTDRQRTAIVAELNGMPLEEIATRMSTTRNAIYKLTYDARKILKTQFEDAGYEPADILKLWTDRPGVSSS